VSASRPTIFIQTNHRQMLGALVSRYSLQRNSAHADKFDVQLMEVSQAPFLLEQEGQTYLRDGDKRPWLNDDLQSFTPLRFLPPELMDYQGRALVIDPDVFAAGDVWDLLQQDMQGHAIVCRPKSGNKGKRGAYASSVMLLDCAQLSHWRTAQNFAEMFSFERDYMDWVSLKLEPKGSIAPLDACWNDFDHLDQTTRLLHNTKRKTQPWKTGLPVDYRPADTFRLFPPRHWIRRARRALFGDYRFTGTYKRHPDPTQEAFFFALLRECVDKGIVSEAQLRDEMASNHVRHDALRVMEQLPPLAA
jgi:hypothetical protein